MKIKNSNTFFRDNPIPMWIFDPSDYSIVDVNNSMIELYGYSREELLSFTVFDLRPSEEVPKLKSYISQLDNNKLDQTKDEGLWKHQKKNGELIYARVTRTPITFDGDDETVYQLVMYRDITSKLNYQQRYEMFFEHNLDGIMLTKPNGDILEANNAACDILGMTEEEIISRGRDGTIAKSEKLEKALQERTVTGKFAGELTFIHKSGQKIPVELTSSVFTNYAGEKRTSLIFRDISDQLQYQQELQASLIEKETLLAEVHHRVKNNLAIINSMMELQIIKTSNQQLHHLLKTSQQRINAIALIHELLYQSENLSYIDFGTNTRQLIATLQDHYDSTQITLDINVDSIRLNVNQAIPCALIINEILTNAFKHAFEYKDEGVISVSVLEENEEVNVSIEDNGTGISETFDLENADTLGMTLVKTLAQQLKGDLEITADKGTKTSLSFEKSDTKGAGSNLIGK